MITAIAEKTIIDMTEPIAVILTNESQGFATDADRMPLENMSFYTDVIVFRGDTEITDFVIGSVSSSNGITVSISGAKITFTITTSTTIAADNGTFIIPVTVDGVTIEKTFSWSCSKQGESAISYFLEPSTLTIKKGYDDAFAPTTVTFSAYYRIGAATERITYAGRFIISESTDGAIFTTKYTSSANESSTIYIPSSADVKTIQCVLYASGSTATALDTQSVVILTDVDNIQPELDNLQDQITINKTSISSVSSDVDAINKKIINMVTQDDITEAINEYDNSTVESIRTRITKTEQDISSITTTISDVQSSLTNKADSSTVQTLSSKVTTIETTVNGVKTTVESNYTELRKDLDSIEVGGRNLIKDTDILYERDNAATAIETYSLNVYPKHLPDIPNRTLTFSFYLHSTGTRDTNLSSDTTLHDYFGISGTILWSDSTGANTDASTITLFTENLSVSNSNSRVSQTVTISPPDGYDTIDAFLFSVQLYAKPASDNDETWQIGYPKLEFGNQDTDWTPAPEDMATQDDINDISNNISETVIQIQTLSEQIIGDDGITSRVTQLEQTTGSMESNILNQCETLITQSASSWRADFEENGATVGKVIISQQGITVQSDGDDKHTALIAGGRFSGYYNPLGTTDDDLGEEIFTLTEDKVVASQLFAKNGADFNSLRIMPFTNEGYVGCVWVKSGGDS